MYHILCSFANFNVSFSHLDSSNGVKHSKSTWQVHKSESNTDAHVSSKLFREAGVFEF